MNDNLKITYFCIQLFLYRRAPAITIKEYNSFEEYQKQKTKEKIQHKGKFEKLFQKILDNIHEEPNEANQQQYNKDDLHLKRGLDLFETTDPDIQLQSPKSIGLKNLMIARQTRSTNIDKENYRN